MDSIKFCLNYILFGFSKYIMSVGPAWSWSYDSWLYNYLCNQCISPPTWWARIPPRRDILNALSDKLVSDLRQVGVFLRYFDFLYQQNWPPRYSRNIVESGVIYHNRTGIVICVIEYTKENVWKSIKKNIKYLQYIYYFHKDPLWMFYKI